MPKVKRHGHETITSQLSSDLSTVQDGIRGRWVAFMRTQQILSPLQFFLLDLTQHKLGLTIVQHRAYGFYHRLHFQPA